jgi:hypothetical protein
MDVEDKGETSSLKKKHQAFQNNTLRPFFFDMAPADQIHADPDQRQCIFRTIMTKMT